MGIFFIFLQFLKQGLLEFKYFFIFFIRVHLVLMKKLMLDISSKFIFRFSLIGIQINFYVFLRNGLFSVIGQ